MFHTNLLYIVYFVTQLIINKIDTKAISLYIYNFKLHCCLLVKKIIYYNDSKSEEKICQVFGKALPLQAVINLYIVGNVCQYHCKKICLYFKCS